MMTDTHDSGIRYSRTAMAGQTTRQYTPNQLKAFQNVGFQVEVPSLKERAQALWKDAGKRMAQGLVDQFAPIKELSKDAYGLLRLSKGASGSFETLLQGGMLKLTDGVYDFDEDIPVYQAYKALVGARSNPSLAQAGRGFYGIGEGLSNYVQAK